MSAEAMNMATKLCVEEVCVTLPNVWTLMMDESKFKEFFDYIQKIFTREVGLSLNQFDN